VDFGERRLRVQELKDALPVELVRIVFRYKIDPYIPDHLFIPEKIPGRRQERWVRGLKKVPSELFYDKWTISRGIPTMFSDYYATIEIDLFAHYAKWTEWIKPWNCIGRAIGRLMLYVTGFDAPQIATLAEVAYFFGESPLIQRLHRDTPVGALQERDRMLYLGTQSNGTRNTTLKDHILISTHAGEMKDGEHEMFGLIKEMARIGVLHHGANTLSREAFRKLVFDWAIGPPDNVLNREQIISRREVDTTKFPIQGTQYTTWAATQPKSSPQKGRFRKHCE
jgi:hypothetical protein